MDITNITESNEAVRLTQYSTGGGCGCKISPAILENILKTNILFPEDKKLLVGNLTNDDAAVYDIGNARAIISTADFFMPIVDDPFTFGSIASANAISDVYAMGGRPLMAIAILGWPIEKLPASVASLVLDGARETCRQAGITLAGGHTIESAEPVFGLSVTGIVEIKNLKQNNSSSAGELIFLTKPIGVGILSTAQKRGVLLDEHRVVMENQMSSLNSLGEILGTVNGVTAMTDVTGFGLLGHLIEMAEGAGISAELFYSRIPVTEGVKEYLSRRIIPDATYRNWNSYSAKVSFEKGVNVMEAFNLLPDPQTNGGLLFSVKEFAVDDITKILMENGFNDHITPVGRFINRTDKIIEVKQ